MLVKIINAPHAVVTAPASVAFGDPVTFDGGLSSADEAEITRYVWDFGDGATAEGGKVTHSYAKPGSYRVALSVSAAGLAEQCRSVTTYHLITVNDPPVADAGDDRVVEVNRALTLSGAKSTDSDGGLTAYHWDFGDGSTAGGIETQHSWRKPGTYKVTLTVTDNTDLSNNTDTDEITVEVNAPPPTTIQAADVACPAETVDFALKDLVAAVDENRFKWTFGDGAEAAGKQSSHAFARPGTYTVAVAGPMRRAGETVESFVSRPIKVNRQPVARAGGNRKTCPAMPVAFDASQSVDLDGGITAMSWDFGDGTTASGAKVSHGFDKPGTYRVRLTVTDDSGSSCAAASDEIEVFVNAPPVADAGPDQEAWIGGARDRFTLDASRSSDADGDALSYYWSLSTGEELDGEKPGLVFLRPGDVTVTLETADVHDLPCSVSSDEMTVHVRARGDQTNAIPESGKKK